MTRAIPNLLFHQTKDHLNTTFRGCANSPHELETSFKVIESFVDEFSLKPISFTPNIDPTSWNNSYLE